MAGWPLSAWGKKKKKQRWKRARDTHSDSGRHIWQALKAKREREDEEVRAAGLGLSPLSIWLYS